MADENYRLTARRLMMNEQAPTLRVTGIDLNAYADQLIERYCNPALKHRTWQIAMDGSQKLPQRMLDSVRWHLKQGNAYPCLALGIAGWMRYVGASMITVRLLISVIRWWIALNNALRPAKMVRLGYKVC